MARPIRIEYEGAVYHVTIRGNERKALFKTDADRERFIQALSDSAERRTALISAAVTGKIDVRHWKAPKPAKIK
jgi:putative transposase